MSKFVKVRRQSDKKTLEVSRKHWDAALSKKNGFELVTKDAGKKDKSEQDENTDKK